MHLYICICNFFHLDNHMIKMAHLQHVHLYTLMLFCVLISEAKI